MNTITSHPPADPPARNLKDLLAAGLGCAVALPVAIWWLVGDRTEQAPAGSRLTYAIDPLELPPWAEHIMGICALLTTVISMAVLVGAFRLRRFDRRWWPPFGALLLAEILMAVLWRALTAGTVGVRSETSRLVVALGMPMLWLLVWAVTWTVWLVLRSRREAARTSAPPNEPAEETPGRTPVHPPPAGRGAVGGPAGSDGTGLPRTGRRSRHAAAPALTSDSGSD